MPTKEAAPAPPTATTAASTTITVPPLGTLPAPTTTTTTSTTLPSYTWPAPTAFPSTMPYLSPRVYAPHTVPIPVPVPMPYLSPRAMAIPPNTTGNMVVQTTHTVRNNHVIRAKLHDRFARIKKAFAGKRSRQATTTTQQTTTIANPDGSTTTTTTTTSTVPPPLAPVDYSTLGAPLDTVTTVNTVPSLGIPPMETTTTTFTIPGTIDQSLWTAPLFNGNPLMVPSIVEEKLTVSNSNDPSSTSDSPRLPDRILLSDPEDVISEQAEAELRTDLEVLPSIAVDDDDDDDIPPPPPLEGDEDNAPPAPAEIVQDIVAAANAAQFAPAVNKVVQGRLVENDSDRIKRIDMRIAEITSANAMDELDEIDTEVEQELDTQFMLKKAMDGLHETERMINNTLERTRNAQIINVTHKAAVEVNDGRGGMTQAARVIQGCAVSGG